ncbi:MAG: aldolase/citrate lyase family protein [Burkholderiaceae bacterium]
MRENKLRQMTAAGETAIGGWIAIGHPYSAEMLGHAGYDTVTVDLQHGPLYIDQAVGALIALSATPAMPMARVSGNNVFEINKLLDAGAYALICPMIDNAEEAARFVSACRYPPKGTRSFGPTRGLLYGGADYFKHANDTIVTYGMIETPSALENLDAIAAVEGLDGLFIGPADLSLAIGASLPPRFDADPLKSTMRRIHDAARSHGKMIGAFCTSVEMAAALKNEGYDYVVMGVDAMLVRSGGEAIVRALRG